MDSDSTSLSPLHRASLENVKAAFQRESGWSLGALLVTHPRGTPAGAYDLEALLEAAGLPVPAGLPAGEVRASELPAIQSLCFCDCPDPDGDSHLWLTGDPDAIDVFTSAARQAEGILGLVTSGWLELVFTLGQRSFPGSLLQLHPFTHVGKTRVDYMPIEEVDVYASTAAGYMVFKGTEDEEFARMSAESLARMTDEQRDRTLTVAFAFMIAAGRTDEELGRVFSMICPSSTDDACAKCIAHARAFMKDNKEADFFKSLHPFLDKDYPKRAAELVNPATSQAHAAFDLDAFIQSHRFRRLGTREDYLKEQARLIHTCLMTPQPDDPCEQPSPLLAWAVDDIFQASVAAIDILLVSEVDKATDGKTVIASEASGSETDGARAHNKEQGWVSCSDLATKHKVSADALRKRLARWRRNHGDGWIEVSNTDRGTRGAQFLYRESAVSEVIRGKTSR